MCKDRSRALDDGRAGRECVHRRTRRRTHRPQRAAQALPTGCCVRGRQASMRPRLRSSATSFARRSRQDSAAAGFSSAQSRGTERTQPGQRRVQRVLLQASRQPAQVGSASSRRLEHIWGPLGCRPIQHASTRLTRNLRKGHRVCLQLRRAGRLYSCSNQWAMGGNGWWVHKRGGGTACLWLLLAVRQAGN